MKTKVFLEILRFAIPIMDLLRKLFNGEDCNEVNNEKRERDSKSSNDVR